MVPKPGTLRGAEEDSELDTWRGTFPSGEEEKSSEEEGSLEDLEDSSSSESSLDPEEDEELEEEAARYEEERYGHQRLRSSGAMAAPRSPSAPLPYSGVGKSHFIKGKIWSRLAAAFPVFENPVTQERAYEPVSYKQLKDLVEAVKTYGVTANYTTALLRRLTVNAMTPTDWYEVAHTCLNHGKFLDLRSIVLDKAQAQYRKNVQDGRADWTVDMLLSQGLHAVDQTNYPFEVYRQVNEIFYQSWRAIPNKGEITGNLTKIIQAAAEPFSDYVARMLDTAERLQVSHSTGLPYNPQGQGIVERANKSLKELLEKQKGGIAEGATPRERLALALFTLNFLNLDDAGETATERHMLIKDRKHLDMVKWKDVLDNKWYGPDPVIMRSRRVVCVFPQNQENPHWVPSRLTRAVLYPQERDEPEVQDDGCLDPDGDPDATMAQQTMPHGEDGTLGGDQSLADADANSC
ncbi:hypothetical protein STEG23_007607 [Scotinomys teguina]